MIRRAAVPVVLSVTGFVVVCCVLLYAGIKRDLVRGTIEQEVRLAGIVAAATRDAMLRLDRESLREIIANVGSQGGVEHLRIFNKAGRISFSSQARETNRAVNKGSEGCLGCHAGPTPTATLGPMEQARQFDNEHGTPVLAITAPIYNEPDCVGASCHPQAQRILGILDVGLSQRPFHRTLAALRTKMALFSILVLVLAVGSTLALLRQGVLLPLGRLADYVRRLEREATPAGQPVPAPELGPLAVAMHRMAADLRSARIEIDRLQQGAQDRAIGEDPNEGGRA